MYPYCIGLKYDRLIRITEEEWKTGDVNVIAEALLRDLEKLNMSCKLVNKTYVPMNNENILALRVGIKWMHGDYLDYTDYHIIIKRKNGYWYSKFGQFDPEKLALHVDIESWDWRDKKKKVPKNYYNSGIVYIALQS